MEKNKSTSTTKVIDSVVTVCSYNTTTNNYFTINLEELKPIVMTVLNDTGLPPSESATSGTETNYCDNIAERLVELYKNNISSSQSKEECKKSILELKNRLLVQKEDSTTISGQTVAETVMPKSTATSTTSEITEVEIQISTTNKNFIPIGIGANVGVIGQGESCGDVSINRVIDVAPAGNNCIKKIKIFAKNLTIKCDDPFRNFNELEKFEISVENLMVDKVADKVAEGSFIFNGKARSIIQIAGLTEIQKSSIKKHCNYTRFI